MRGTRTIRGVITIAGVLWAFGSFLAAACGSSNDASGPNSDGGGDATSDGSLDSSANDSGRDGATTTTDSGASGLPVSAFGLNYTASIFDAAVPNNPWPPPNMTFGSVRAWDNGTAWMDLEPDAGTFDFSNLDAMHALAVSSGIHDFEYTAGMTPNWAATDKSETGCHGNILGACSPPSDVNSGESCASVPSGGTGDCRWKEFIHALFAHATVAGTSYIRKFAPWNEFTTDHEFWTETEPYPMLAQMAQDAYEVIKKIDPTVIVFTPSSTGPGGPLRMCQYLNGGTHPGQYADAFNFHTYLDVTHLYPPEQVLARLDAYKACLTADNLTLGKDIYSDEGGWGENLQTNLPNSPNADCDGGCMVASSDTATAFIARYYLLQLFWGVKSFWWYGSGADEWGSLAQLSADKLTFTPFPDATAYSQVEQWLVGSTLLAPCTNGDAGTVWTCDLTRESPAGYTARVVWDAAGSSTYTNPKSSLWVHVRDLSGSPPQTLGGSLTIGPLPQLLEP